MSESTKQAIGPNQEKWLVALESGDYPQGKGVLCSNSGYCCLGVGTSVFDVPYTTHENGTRAFDGRTAFAPPEVVDALALHDSAGMLYGKQIQANHCLTAANDNGIPFAEIAAFCRDNPEAVFTEPR